MSNTERKRVLNYRNDNGLAPNPDNIDYGEIAIGYKKDNEAIYIKTTANDIVDFTPISIVNITYNALKELRDNSKLKPSQYYRITDFVTTVANDPEAQSAGHPFDIIVLASNKNRLQEECYAIQHEGDTYFANCNLAAWKIWYCLDNDNTKYAWADTTNGKGVIYRMIDEWQNDCPYDFKNVQFKRYAVADASTNGPLADLNGTYIGYKAAMEGLSIPDQSDFRWAYTFSLTKEDEYVDYSSNGLYGPFTEGVGYFKQTKKGQCVYNALSNTYGLVNIDGQFYASLILNNIVLISKRNILSDLTDGFPTEMVYNTFGIANFNMTLKDDPESNKFDNGCYNNIVSGYANTFGNGCYSNTFGNGCGSNTFGNGCYSNTFGNDCDSNSFGNGCDNNTFGNNCNDNTFGDGCSNSFGNDCDDNSFGNNCYSNTFGDGCSSNTFGNNCNDNTFGNNCVGNSFGNDCYSNTFEGSCGSNSFGNECHNNTFGYGCYSNTFGNKCYSNTFVDSCYSNKFGYSCYSNSFGNECDNNTFVDGCFSNTFGDRCSSNSFGDYCSHNTFVDGCSSNSFGNSCSHNTFGDYFQYNALGNNIQYIEIPTEKIYHTQILNGTQGTKANKLTLEFTPETTYSQFAGFTSDNVLETWVEADDTVDGGSY